MRPSPTRPTVAALALLVGTVASAQTGAGAPKDDTLYFSTTVGSFKLLPPGPDKTRGTLDMDFDGTLMVSGLEGSAKAGAGVRLEYERKDHDRQVYFGKGHIHLTGNFRAIQFFGRNLKGDFSGVAVARLYGEFDKNMETGYYWYASQPEKKDWGSYGQNLSVPPYRTAGPSPGQGKVRDVPKKGG